jgi:hypothetical protein
VVIVLAIVPKVHGFKPGRGQWIFKNDKIRSTTSFGGEVKPSLSCRNILLHLYNPAEYDRDTWQTKLTDIFLQVSTLPLGVCWYLLESSG